jgi:hypothetical protein
VSSTVKGRPSRYLRPRPSSQDRGAGRGASPTALRASWSVLHGASRHRGFLMRRREPVGATAWAASGECAAARLTVSLSAVSIRPWTAIRSGTARRIMMRRRDFIVGLGGIAASPLAVLSRLGAKGGRVLTRTKVEGRGGTVHRVAAKATAA